ncbi:MAG: ribose-phosphate pyrophosphokinase [Tissierellia bacterium]|nr:ribose-phosphate pyrophosphokinase [Tissierellia bacterium]
MRFKTGDLKVFSGSASTELAESICSRLGLSLSKLEITRFSDGEIGLEIGETVRGKDVYIIQSTCPPVNENLMELLIIIDACRRASAARVNVVLPYYGYARQDRKSRGREPVTAKLVANLIETAGADRLISFDLHSGQIQGFFDIPVDHLTARRELTAYFEDILDKDFVVVSPDLGGVTRARNFAKNLDIPLAIVEKRRPKPNVSEVIHIIGNVEGKNCIIVDDMIDTAGTIVNAAESLVKRGAKKVYITATHGIFSGNAVERIENSVVEKCVVADTIPLGEKAKKCDKIDIVTVADTLAVAIKKINNNESVSILFE